MKNSLSNERNMFFNMMTLNITFHLTWLDTHEKCIFNQNSYTTKMTTLFLSGWDQVNTIYFSMNFTWATPVTISPNIILFLVKNGNENSQNKLSNKKMMQILSNLILFSCLHLSCVYTREFKHKFHKNLNCHPFI